MELHTFAREQFIARPREEVFAFFARPENLGRITPPFLGLRLLTPRPVPMRAGALVDYVVSPLGLPSRWTTLITEYNPPRRFVDVQVRGPYAFWHHTHEFQEAPGGTRVVDRIRYALPVGRLGEWAAGRKVRGGLERVFDYRRAVLERVLSMPEERGKPMKVVLAGGTGFIGGAVREALAAGGHRVICLTRRPFPAELQGPAASPEGPKSRWPFPAELQGPAASPEGPKSRRPDEGPVSFRLWDGRTPGDWAAEAAGADAVVNFSGENVAAGRWTPRRKRVLWESRLEPTRALVEALSKVKPRPRVLVNASAVGYYGDAPSGEVTEGSARGFGFLADLTDAWEGEARRAEALGLRVVLPRFGVVLGRGGGALGRMALPFKLFAGGPLGSGRQWFPWVHVDDAVGTVLFALRTEALSGSVNVTAPETVTNQDFSRALGHALGRPAWARVPAPVLRALLGEMADSLLASQKVVPEKLVGAGYRFRYPDLRNALAEAIGVRQP